MGQSSSRNKYLVEDDTSFVEISKDLPYEDWLLYLRNWINVDSKMNKNSMLDLIDDDIKNKKTQNSIAFNKRYSYFSDNLGSLGKCAFEVTKSNFMLWDLGIPPNIKA